MTAAASHPRPIKEKGRRPDIETELSDHFHVEFTYLSGVPTSDFDIDKSLHNQARFVAVDEATALVYQEGVERGDPFPAVIAYRPGRGVNAKLVTIDGNHRLVSHDRAGQPIDVYEVDRGTKAQTIALMTFAFNTRHGRPTSEDERVTQAIYLIDNGASSEAAAAAVNVPMRILKKAINKANADRRANEVGIDMREWENLGQSTRARLLNVSTDEGFQDASHLAYAAGLGAEEVFDLVTMLNTSKSGTKQRALVKSETSRFAERIQDNAAGTLTTNKTGRSITPRARLGMVLGQIMALPEDNDLVARAFSEGERTAEAKRVDEASSRLRAIAKTIDPSLR